MSKYVYLFIILFFIINTIFNLCMSKYIYIFVALVLVFGFIINTVRHWGDWKIDEYKKQNGLLSNETEIKIALGKFQLSKYYDSIAPLIRWGIDLRLTETEESRLLIGSSKFGGRPDLPSDVEWPKSGNGTPMEFVAQINLEEARLADVEEQMPAHGIVYLFFSFTYAVEDYRDPQCFKVIYVEKPEGLSRRDFPEDVERKQPSKKIDFIEYLSLPTFDWSDLKKMGMTEAEQDAYYELCGTHFQIVMLGHILTVQGPMEYDCEDQRLQRNMGNLLPESWEERSALFTQLDSWIPFFYLNNDWLDPNGDGSDIAFYIQKQDLKNGDFNKMCLVIQAD